MRKRILSIGFVILLFYSLLMPVHAAEGDAFAGEREVCFSVDWSDLNNFVDGARPVFDLLLRSSAPEWLTYDIQTQGHDLNLSLRFSFESLDDYRDKVAELILRPPTILYTQDDGAMLIESFGCMDLLNFMEAVLVNEDLLSERRLHDIFKFTGSTLTIGDDTIETGETVCIYPDAHAPVRIDHLQIETETQKDHAYSRSITVQIDLRLGSGSDADILEEQFAQIGKTERSKVTDDICAVSVSFEAVSRSDLAYKTMMCLKVPCYITENETYTDDDIIQVERTEYICLDLLLREDGAFDYTFYYPSYWSELTSEDGSTVISNAAVVSQNKDLIVYGYQRKLQFQTVTIHTDLSAPTGEIKRTISCTVPINIAERAHQTIKDKLKRNMINGCVMDIYDDLDLRHYEISYSSWSIDQIEGFTGSILGMSDYTMDHDTSWIPFGSCEISDRFDVDHMLSRTVPADAIIVEYSFPELSWFSGDLDECATIEDHTVSFSLRSGDQIQIVYRQVQGITCLLLVSAVLVLLIIYRSVKRRLHRGSPARRRPAQRKKRRMVTSDDTSSVSHSETMIPPFCGYCGEKTIVGSRFCQKCGADLEKQI